MSQETAGSLPTALSRRRVVQPHIDSFNYFLDEGLPNSVACMRGVDIDGPNGKLATLKLRSVEVSKPMHLEAADTMMDARILPAECRQRHITYAGQALGTFEVTTNEGLSESIEVPLGNFPIMVRTTRCHLGHTTASKQDLIDAGEDETEQGGYFIVNGNEKVIRMLINPRRNFPQALIRPSFEKRGRGYTHFGCTMRCVRAADQTSRTMTVHYLNSGQMTLRFSLRKNEYLVPLYVALRVLAPPELATDRAIFECLASGHMNDAFVRDRVELVLREGRSLAQQHGRDGQPLESPAEWRAHLGRLFRTALKGMVSEHDSDAAVGAVLIRELLFVHAPSDRDKFNSLVSMVRKLLALVQGKIRADNADLLSQHEALLPGHLLTNFVSEKLHEVMVSCKYMVQRDMTDAKRNERKAKFAKCYRDASYYKRVLGIIGGSVGHKIESLLSTGNLISSSGLDLMQVGGFAVVADRINYWRFMSHFRAIHRGAFFTEMKTTDVRKLMPETWGFLCPVHTPDGSPCGLLNHLAAQCHIQANSLSLTPSNIGDFNIAGLKNKGPKQRRKLLQTLFQYGMVSAQSWADLNGSNILPVQLDGILIGFVGHDSAKLFCNNVRKAKALGVHGVPEYLEIAATLDANNKQHLGIELCTGAARFLRPVRNLACAKIEWVAPLEQMTLDVACVDSDTRPETTHQELSPQSMLSNLALCTPFSDYNQSPRNMYQCQMAKQSLGIPAHAMVRRGDNKLYKIQTPQKPMVRTDGYKALGLNDYPVGQNAVVAVISYTGYDMEDAMIVNKQAMERGFVHASVYKTEVIDLGERRVAGEPIHDRFANPPKKVTTLVRHKKALKDEPVKTGPSESRVDADGLPRVGTFFKRGDPIYTVHNDTTGRVRVVRYKYDEPAYLDQVQLLGGERPGELQKLALKWRINRNPVIGDKFASRAGQKGTLSQLWPHESMPFTGEGIVPDIIINPHAFPSRMTIGMLIESMAGKEACMSGEVQNASPFQECYRSDLPGRGNYPAVDSVADQLQKHGFHRYGTEQLYSGITGECMEAHIFIGIVHYQRLRHMILDKAQVRALGPVNMQTRQPVKGRKNKGGVRFGEMERDALIGHGTSFLLKDRLANCSDYATTHVCRRCGSMLAPVAQKRRVGAAFAGVGGARTERTRVCAVCGPAHQKELKSVQVPYSLQYLSNELAAMNVRLDFAVSSDDTLGDHFRSEESLIAS
ncbi:MAG: hypothetical protein MHM6MM_000805 [Cercozoa sp. M6MM]